MGFSDNSTPHLARSDCTDQNTLGSWILREALESEAFAGTLPSKVYLPPFQLWRHRCLVKTGCPAMSGIGAASLASSKCHQQRKHLCPLMPAVRNCFGNWHLGKVQGGGAGTEMWLISLPAHVWNPASSTSTSQTVGSEQLTDWHYPQPPQTALGSPQLTHLLTYPKGGKHCQTE